MTSACSLTSKEGGGGGGGEEGEGRKYKRR